MVADVSYTGQQTAREVVSATPTDTQHPALYERAVLILGVLAGACVVGMVALSLLGRAGSAELGTIAGVAVGALAALLTPRG